MYIYKCLYLRINIFRMEVIDFKLSQLNYKFIFLKLYAINIKYYN